MEYSYGQFCTVSRAAEALCERWTPLVVRELLCGSKRFNDVHRGVPRMSTSLLAQRLRHLEDIGVVRRVACGKVWEYSLTEAGEELRPIIMALGEWGARWIGGTLGEHELDPGLLLWDMRRSLRPDAFPAGTTVVAIRFRDARPGEQLWWLLVHERVAELWREDPGRELTLIIESSVRALTEIWRGDLAPAEAIRLRQVVVQGDAPVWDWLGRSAFAHAAKAH